MRYCGVSADAGSGGGKSQASQYDNFGAPNVVRGGSHMKDGGIRAADEVRAGRCSTLVSDYYYPALPQAPFILADAGRCPARGCLESCVSQSGARRQVWMTGVR